MNRFKKYFSLLKDNKFNVIISIVAAIFYSGSMVLISYLVGEIINTPDKVDYLLVYLILAILVASMSLLSLKFTSNVIAYEAENKLRNEYLCIVEKTSLIDLDKHPSGYYINNIITNISNVADSMNLLLSDAISGVIMLILTLVTMGIMNYKVLLFVVLFSPLSIVISKLISSYSYKWNKEVLEYKNGFTSISVENINNHNIIKDFKASEYINADYCHKSLELARLSKKSLFISSLVNPSTRLISSILYAGVLLISAIKVIESGDASLCGEIVTLLALVTNYTKPFNEITNIYAEIQTGFASLDKLEELKNVSFEVNGTEVIKEINSIEFHNVSFGYGKPFIESLFLSIKKNTKVAIVGHTGSGKTTIVNLLMKFYNTDSGDILVNGMNIKDIDINSFRDLTGMVLQNPWIKECSLKENIVMGHNVNDDVLNKILKDCYLDSLVSTLPNGIDTIISNDDSISKGYKQLISIARVMAKNPEFVILDEATSNLDTLTEKHIYESMDKTLKDKTAIVIAHRLKTIENADFIIVMEKGNIVEVGTHKELIDKKGYYYNLYYAK